MRVCEKTVKWMGNRDEKQAEGGAIFVIEDEPSILDSLHYALRSEGFHVLSASTLAAARERLVKETPRAIILDIGLPDGSGLDFLRELRSERHIPVILLTARGGEVDKILGLELGADDYVVKPFSPREVVARIRAVLRRIETHPLPVGGNAPHFVIDSERHCIRFKGRELSLSRYEFRILATLIRRPGWVFSREKLMDLCWEEPEASMERTVDAHVKTLRAKLKAIEPQEEMIRTHRGVGYSLREE